MIYNKNFKNESKIRVNKGYEGEPLERLIERKINNNEPMDGMDNVPLIYTEKIDGVMPGYDIRTDRWEVAVEASDKVSKGRAAKSKKKAAKKDVKIENEEIGNQSTDGE